MLAYHSIKAYSAGECDNNLHKLSSERSYNSDKVYLADVPWPCASFKLVNDLICGPSPPPS